MKKVALIGSMLLLCLIFLTARAPSPALASAEPPAAETLAQSNTAFGVQLYRQLSQGSANTFFSPYSVSSALAMTYGGAREETAREMKAALHFQLDQDRLPAAFKALNAALAQGLDPDGQKLRIANALILTGGDVGPAYKQLLKNSYDAEIFPGDLGAVNSWVRQKTEAGIDKILDQLDPNSVCVILNAIYFKGIWERAFDQSLTREAPFQRPGAEPSNVRFMNQKNDFKLLSQEDFQAISIPYKGNTLAMLIFLPRKVEGLSALEAKMNRQSLPDWFAALERQAPRKVALSLPRFKFETGYDLARPLKQMGMKNAFEMERADFRGMGWPKGKLYISQVKHKAFIEVNEEGTQAAAATAVEMATKSMPAPPEVFRADHPFLFFIRHNPTGTLLFMGRMVAPSPE